MIEAIEAVASHHTEAATSSGAWQQSVTSIRVLQRMLDVVDYGILLVSDDGSVAYTNQLARVELDRGHPLTVRGQMLQTRQLRDLPALREALHTACHKGLQKLLTLFDECPQACRSAAGPPRGKSQLGSGPPLTHESEASVSIAVLPMSDTVMVASPAAMVVLGKRSVCDDLSADAFARHHGLTAAEARVLRHLCSGRRPAEIARQQGVALSTVRTQIGCLREKTRAPSIGALLSEVARLPPMVNLFRAVG